jgi:hypothetical protein
MNRDKLKRENKSRQKQGIRIFERSPDEEIL